MGLGGEGFGLGFQLGVALEEVGVEDFEHGGAGAGGDDDVLAVLELLKDSLGEFGGVAAEAGVKEGLAAAGLAGGEVHGHALASKDIDYGLADLGEELVD